MGWVHKGGHGCERHDLPASIDQLFFKHAFFYDLKDGFRILATSTGGMEQLPWRFFILGGIALSLC
jgi:hypothetical protein